MTTSQHDRTTAANSRWAEIWAIFEALDDGRQQELADFAQQLIAEQRAA
jgi:hypothetical protein